MQYKINKNFSCFIAKKFDKFDKSLKFYIKIIIIIIISEKI